MRLAILLCTLALTALAAPAFAGLPKPNATYTGKITLGDFAKPPNLTLKVAKSGRRMTATLSCAGKSYKLKGISIDDDGHFDKTGPVGGPAGTIDGKFTSAKKAEGSFAAFRCQVSDSAAFKVKRR